MLDALAAARAYVGNDSGPTHLAAMLGIPTVAIFGPSNPAVWSPVGPAVRIVQKSPLDSLPLDEVLAATREMLSG